MSNYTSNGWTVYLHPLMEEQYRRLLSQVERLRQKDPTHYQGKNPTKRLYALSLLMHSRIPSNPQSPEYLLGNTLGAPFRGWRRAKFFQQYRLFFRFNEERKVIIFCWVNDDRTKRACESRTDAYRVFGKMLASGHPPTDFAALLQECRVRESD